MMMRNTAHSSIIVKRVCNRLVLLTCCNHTHDRFWREKRLPRLFTVSVSVRSLKTDLFLPKKLIFTDIFNVGFIFFHTTMYKKYIACWSIGSLSCDFSEVTFFRPFLGGVKWLRVVQYLNTIWTTRKKTDF